MTIRQTNQNLNRASSRGSIKLQKILHQEGPSLIQRSPTNNNNKIKSLMFIYIYDFFLSGTQD